MLAGNVCLLSVQLLVHGCGSTASVAHGQDDGGSAAHDVTAGIDGGDGRLHVVIDGDGAFASELKSRD